jgi:hypothetical protein
MKRWLKTLLLVVAIFLLPTLWVVISHVRAKHALERYKAQLRAAGEKLTVDESLPPRIPPEQNGAKLFLQAHPSLQLEGVLGSNPPPAMRKGPAGKALIGWQQSEIIFAYGDEPIITNSWKEIEQALKKAAPSLELLHQAAARPGFNLEFDYHNSSSLGLSNLASLKGAVLLLTAAAVSDLNRGDTPSAVTNVHASLVLVNESKDERLLISQLVRFAMASVASTAQWELAQSTNLTDPELAMLQHDWESMDLVSSMENAFKMERLWSLAEIEQLRSSNSPSAAVSSGLPWSPASSTSSGALDFIKDIGQSASLKTSDLLWRICWSYDDELHELQVNQVAIETLRQIETNGFFDKALAEQDRRIKALGLNNRTNNWLRTHLNNDMLNMLDGAPASNLKTVNRLLRTEATRRVTITAIALKRYQLRHGVLPASLNALSPEFISEIPSDPTDGSSLSYQPNPDGTFTLNSGSWVWTQPATPEEVQQYYKNLQKRNSALK